MKIHLIPLILLLAACNQQSDTTQTIQPTASQPVRQTASAPDNAENQALTDEQIRKQAAEQVLQYAQARHCGNATLVAAEQASLDNTDKLNPAEAAIILDTSKHEDSQESLIAVLYHGHEQGKSETAAVLAFAQNLPQTEYRSLRYEFINQQNCPPIVLAIEKLATAGK